MPMLIDGVLQYLSLESFKSNFFSADEHGSTRIRADYLNPSAVFNTPCSGGAPARVDSLVFEAHVPLCRTKENDSCHPEPSATERSESLP
jgi:hypothetical protein